MPFPDSERVIYQHNPLEQVICQLRFPTILRIDSELPARFQEEVRAVYPLFSEPQTISAGSDFPQEIMRLVGSLMPIRPARVYEFSSADGVWKLTLSKDFIALACAKYERWEHFFEHLRGPLEALKAEYAPAFFSRVGLRYRNVILRSGLGLDGVEWKDLLQQHISAELGTPVRNNVEGAMHQVVIRLDEEGSKVKIQHGIAETTEREQAYLIDNDFFREERTELTNVDRKLDYFHSQSGKLFQWCITKRLHDAMEPKVLERV